MRWVVKRDRDELDRIFKLLASNDNDDDYYADGYRPPLRVRK